jgi:ParB-like chromosome segregation protein Spo0J
MQIESLPIADLHPDPANARLHPARNLEAITSSLARFGQQKPIVIDANNVVRAGNGTLAAAVSLGWTHINVVRSNLLGVEATAFAIADNRSAELATWDPDLLSAALNDPDIGPLGFNDDELKEWLHQEIPTLGDDDDNNPQPPTTIPESFQLVVNCPNEQNQKDLYDRLTTEGLACRLLTL